MGVWTPGPGPTSGNDRFDGNSTGETADGAAGDDLILGNGGNDTLIGGAGDDTLNGGVGIDTMTGGQGNDLYIVDSIDDVIVEFGTGVDSVRSSVTYTLISGVEKITLSGTANIGATGNGQNNTMVGNSGVNAIYGAAGLDILYGNAGNDILDGGLGADKMNGGDGSDTLIGEVGDDTFVFNPGGGQDAITGFVAAGAEDSIDLSAYNGSGVTWDISQVDADSLFTFSNGDTITLTNVDMNDLVYDGLFGYS